MEALEVLLGVLAAIRDEFLDQKRCFEAVFRYVSGLQANGYMRKQL
jgi:hypothetical protein